jgi:hypothetical protein
VTCRNCGPPPSAGSRPQLRDHITFDCVWEFREPAPTVNYMGEATVFWPSTPGLDGPDHFACHGAFPKSSPENSARFGLPDASWILFGALARPTSRGRVHLTGADLEAYVRDAGRPTGTRLGLRRWVVTRCPLSKAVLKVHGCANLRVADGSIMPRITTGKRDGAVRRDRRAGGGCDHIRPSTLMGRG